MIHEEFEPYPLTVADLKERGFEVLCLLPDGCIAVHLDSRGRPTGRTTGYTGEQMRARERILKERQQVYGTSLAERMARGEGFR